VKPRHLATDFSLVQKPKQLYVKFEIYVVDGHVEKDL
jgi:hypothetical protein